MTVRHFLFAMAACAAFCAAAPASHATAPTRGQTNDTTVIAVDGRRIGTEEFESRMNLFSVDAPSDPSQRKRFVALALIQETILAQAAREVKIDTLHQVTAVIHQYEKEAAYEAWMAREVRSKIAVSDEEILGAYERYRQQRVVDYLVFNDSLSARKAERRLRLARARSTPDSDTLPETKVLEYGEAFKHVEDALFSLKPGGTSVQPVDGKWYLFRLRAVEPHPTRATQSFPQAYDAVSKLVRREKELEILGHAMSAVMADRSFRLAPQARDHLYRLLSERIPFANPQISKFPELVNQEIARRTPPATDLKETFLTFRTGGTMSLGQLWNAITTGPYLLNYRSPAELRGGLDYLIRRVIMIETVTDDAYRRGYDRTSYVATQKAMWSDNLLSNLLQYRLSESFTPTEAELHAESEGAKGTADEIRQRVLQRKTHAAIDSIMNERLPRTPVAVDTAVLSRTHALEGSIVVRKEHFPNRFAVPRLIPPNPEAAWARRLLRQWGEPQ